SRGGPSTTTGIRCFPSTTKAPSSSKTSRDFRCRSEGGWRTGNPPTRHPPLATKGGPRLQVSQRGLVDDREPAHAPSPVFEDADPFGTGPVVGHRRSIASALLVRAPAAERRGPGAGDSRVAGWTHVGEAGQRAAPSAVGSSEPSLYATASGP